MNLKHLTNEHPNKEFSLNFISFFFLSHIFLGNSLLGDVPQHRIFFKFTFLNVKFAKKDNLTLLTGTKVKSRFHKLV